MKVIGIAGQKGSGKDTVARMILEHVKPSTTFQVFHFADHLKKCCSLIHGVDERFFDERELKDATIPGMSVTPRKLMCDTADALKAMVGPDFFVKHVRKQILELPTTDLVIVADVRFPMETMLVDEFGGHLLHVTRSSLVPDPIPHNSEVPLVVRPSDYPIENNGSMDDLVELLKKYLRSNRLAACGTSG